MLKCPVVNILDIGTRDVGKDRRSIHVKSTCVSRKIHNQLLLKKKTKKILILNFNPPCVSVIIIILLVLYVNTTTERGMVSREEEQLHVEFNYYIYIFFLVSI